MKDETKIPEINDTALIILVQGLFYAEEEMQPVFKKMLDEGKKIEFETYCKMCVEYMQKMCEEHEREKGNE